MIHESMLASIHAAFADGASPEARAAAAQACRTLLAVLEPAPGQPVAMPASSPPSSVPTDPMGQLLDAIITKWGALLPQDQRPKPLEIPFVPIPPRSP